eukprot:COSAG03_NODE_177_length_11096_cov_1567.562062_3_plen_115_part_00
MSPGGGFNPGTSVFSIFFNPALLLPPAFFFLPFFLGFFGGSGCRTVSAAKPAIRLLFLAAGFAFGFFDAGFFVPAGFLCQRQCASFLPAADVPFLANAFPALLHSALLIFAMSL